MKVYAGVDIGGTYTKAGVLGDEFESVSFATPKNREALIEEIIKTVSFLSKSKELAGVGIGCPGAVSKDGKVSYMPNLPVGEMDFSEIKRILGVDVKVSNDASVAALGECIKGGFSDAVMLTLGTGVGGGIVIDGKIYDGKFGKAGEIGHMIICADGRKCGCGMNGCLEAYASATALIKRTAEVMLGDENSVMWEICPDISRVDARVAFDAERLGDRSAAMIVNEYIKYLGIGIINICNIFRPEAVIIGGGISGEGQNLILRLKEYCKKFDYGYKYSYKPQIIKSSLGNNAGLYGAIAMIKDNGGICL